MTRPFLSCVVHFQGFSPDIYWPIKCIPKPLFMRVFKVTRITYNWHLKTFICGGVWGCKNHLHLLANWMHFKILICMIIQGYKNSLHLLANWMHSKTFNSQRVWVCKNYLYLLTNWMHFKTFIYWGVMFELARITCIYWLIECTSKT